MNANERKLKELIRTGEGISTEFKTCRNSLSRDVYETVCAFLNRHGGTILLGVQDLDELELELLAKCRKIAVLRREDHPWQNMDDMELLKSAQLYL